MGVEEGTHIIEDQGIDCIHGNRSRVKVGREDRSSGKGDGDNEGCKEVEEGFIDFLENENFGADFPPAEFPIAEDVVHIVVHPCDEEVVPLQRCSSESPRKGGSL